MGAATLSGAPRSPQEQARQVRPNDFVRASRQHQEPFDDRSIALSASTTTSVGPIDVAAFGFLRHIVLLITCTGGSGTAGVFADDGPWNILDNVQLTDVNGTPIVGPVSGFDLFLINKWGAYVNDSNPVNSPSYDLSTSNLNPSFLLRIPVEITERDALGALPNMSAAQAYKLSYTISAGSTVYSTQPGTTLPTVRVRAWVETWAQPDATDLLGVPNQQVPPAVGTTQFWTKTVVNITQGDQRVRLTRVGNLIRNLILVYRNDATPSVRNTTEIPDPGRWEWDGKILTNEGRAITLQHTRERYGMANDTGVLVWDFTHDLDGKPGNELRNLYLPTTQAARLEYVGSFGGSGTLTILTNDVAAAQPVPTGVQG